MLGQREEVAAHIAAGFAEAERGDLIDGDAVVEVLRNRRAQRLEAAGMSAAFQLTPQAVEDLDAIWWIIAEDNRDAADRVEVEILTATLALGDRF
jgi:hypothetical protein